jgi:hypothetical protein
MNAFELGFYKETLDSGMPKERAAELWKSAMGFAPAAAMFNQPNLDGQADTSMDPHMLQLAAAMQQQVANEHALMGAQQTAQLPVG